MPPSCSIILDLQGFKLIEAFGRNLLTLRVEYLKVQACPRCDHTQLRIKDTFWRRIRHIHFGQHPTWIEVKSHKYSCYRCKTYFKSRFEGVKKYRRVTEPGRDEIAKLHHGGFTKAEIADKFRLGTASVERWYQEFFAAKNREYLGAHCPRVIGIDEHFFTRKQGYATTIADLRGHKVFDVVLGRSEASLRSYLRKLIGKERVQVVVMDLSETYRSIAKKHFSNALIVADRFQVIRLVNQQFVKTWGEFDEKGRKHRGLLSLMRRRPDQLRDDQKTNFDRYLRSLPGLFPLYTVWQDLLRILRSKGLNQRGCRQIIPEFLWIIEELKKHLLSIFKLWATR